jgi:hypothetical protein
MLSNSVVGCCPSGQTCSGFNGEITTLSMTSSLISASATTAPSIPTNTPFNPNGGQSIGPPNGGGAYIQTIPGGNSVGGNGGVIIVGPVSQNGGNGGGYNQNPYNFAACTTMTMVGAPLPTWKQAPCGTMLIVSPPSPIPSGGAESSRSYGVMPLIGLGVLVVGLFMV